MTRAIRYGFVIAVLCAGRANAQQPTHSHYEQSEKALQPGPGGVLAPRLQNLGTHTFKVTTKSARAQLFINQGLNLTYGFNHAEAGRAFAEAARLDPSCAMAYWGQALVLGPNINAPMTPEDEPTAYQLVQKAVAAKKFVTLRERGYIDALAARYTGNAGERQQADRAFADAMRTLHRKYPADLDAATLFAEALMDLRPWMYWTRDNKPHAETEEAIAALRNVIARNPKHPGALHYWIHLWEPTATPERAEEEADRLLPLMPGAGHIIHMPAHIYLRVGRYADVVTSNQRSVAADEDYIAQCRAQGMYPLSYYPHNIHFIWYGATMLGQGTLAIASARKLAAAVPREALERVPFLQGFLVVPYYALVRFGRWDVILNEPKPTHDTIFTRGVWHYARGTALSAKGRLDEAQQELDALQKIVSDPALPALPASFSLNTPDAILRIAPEVLAGDMAARRKDYDTALLHLERAVRYEDALVYTEPPDWHAPVRQSLGAVLLAAGRPVEAEAVYWEDLKRNRENGWSLFGLMQALNAQGKKDDAAMIQKRFEKAWTGADAKLTASGEKGKREKGEGRKKGRRMARSLSE
jgi:tetratricopeptide (TPR) repeat protein